MKDKSSLYLDKIAKIIGNLKEDEINWKSILKAFDFEHLLKNHERLVTSQYYGDEDYPRRILNVLEEAYKENPDETKQMIHHILQHELVHEEDIKRLDDALRDYPGLNEFINGDIPQSDINNNKKSRKKLIKVFISYSSKDKLVGAKIKDILASFGIESFMAHEDISVSQEWKEKILEELKEADVFIPILSENFRNSDWCSQESGVACFRNILIIPLSLDGTMPYGFMSHRQGKIIDADNIPINYIVKPISDNFPEMNVTGKLIEKLAQCRNYRGCESYMSNLEPYFDLLNHDEVNRIVDISIENNQIWPANLCREKYLPKFLEINIDKIENDKLETLMI